MASYYRSYEELVADNVASADRVGNDCLRKFNTGSVQFAYSVDELLSELRYMHEILVSNNYRMKADAKSIDEGSEQLKANEKTIKDLTVRIEKLESYLDYIRPDSIQRERKQMMELRFELEECKAWNLFLSKTWKGWLYNKFLYALPVVVCIYNLAAWYFRKCGCMCL